MKHVECAGGIVIWNNQVLMIHQNKNSWSLPKGHVEPGEDLEQAARREIREESGLESLDLVRKLGIIHRHRIGLDGQDDQSELKDIHIFLFLSSHGVIGSEEPQSIPTWMEPNQAITHLTHPKDVAFFSEIFPVIQPLLCEPISIVITTLPSRSEAEKISALLINKRVAACVQQIGPIESVFEWQGTVQTQSEWRLEIKTTVRQSNAVVGFIRDHHPYELPEILISPVLGGLSSYKKWVANSVGPYSPEA